MEILYTVNPGIEDIAAEEIKAELGGNVEYSNLSGHVFHVLNTKIEYNALLRLRSINRAFIVVYRGFIGRGFNALIDFRKKLYETFNENIIDSFISPITTFAVETERVGVHEYTSIDISRIVGDVVISFISGKKGYKPRVDLRKPQVIIHVFVREENIYVGISLTGPISMHRRGYRIYEHPASLKPTLAYAMITLTGTRDKNVVVDPMCGGGTIAIETRLYHEDISVYCMDINPRYIRMARANAYVAGVRDLIEFHVWDARRIDEASIPDIDHIISNPPYGIRYGDPWTIRRLYEIFLEKAFKKLNNNGRITIITTEYNFVRKKALNIGYKRIHERVVKHGGLYPHIIVLEKQ